MVEPAPKKRRMLAIYMCSTRRSQRRAGPRGRCAPPSFALTSKPRVSIPRRLMGPAKVLRSVVHGGFLLAAMSLPACAKTPPEAQSAPAASAPTSVAAGQDTALPPGIDASKLDDFQKKVFFRIINNEPSICGQAQSLIASAKSKTSDCRRSFNAIRYVGKLVEQGF